MTNVAIKDASPSQQMDREESSRVFHRRLDEARKQEADEERDRRESVRRRLLRTG